MENVTLIYCSCERYKFLIHNFFIYFDSFFDKFDGEIVSTLGSDITINNHFIKGIGMKNKEKNWSDRLKEAIKISRNNIILLMLDDFYLNKKVNETAFKNAINILVKDNSIGYILLSDHRTNIISSNYSEEFGIVNKKESYLISTQAGLWKKEYLKKIIRSGENAWEFEEIGTMRAAHYKEKILYRTNATGNIISYPFGGIIWQGKFHQESIEQIDRTLLQLNLNELDDFNIVEKPIIKTDILSKTINKIKHIIWNRYKKIYPKLSIIFKHIKYHHLKLF